jgi:outer membrane biosynthesis protein TonB
VATVGLHGLLVAAGWGGVPAPPAVSLPEPVPLQVMLLTERVGTGDAPLAEPMPALDTGTPVPLPPPAAEPDAAPESHRPDRPALPVTAPDFASLAALPMPVAAIRLRLHVEASGEVSRVDVLESDPGDSAFVQRLVEILLATRHIPARRDGEDVASVKEVSLDFGPGR